MTTPLGQTLVCHVAQLYSLCYSHSSSRELFRPCPPPLQLSSLPATTIFLISLRMEATRSTGAQAPPLHNHLHLPSPAVTRTQPCFLTQPTLPLWPLPHPLLENITLATQLLLSSSVFPWLAHSEGVVSFLHPVLYLIIIITPSGRYDFPNFTNEKNSL